MLTEVFRLIFGNEIMKGADHVGEEAVVFAGNGGSHNTVLMPEEVGVVNIQRREIIET